MTLPFGNRQAHAAFAQALANGTPHHAWLLAGPQGVGKAGFAEAAAIRMLAEAIGEVLPPGLDTPPDSRTRRLVENGAHPDFRRLTRAPKDDKPDAELARSIPIAQVRGLLPMFATRPALSTRRVVMIDAIDDVERPGASNALLKSLEEPPTGTIFLLMSHAPGRLLPTIRSRCRLLRFHELDDGDMAAALRRALPDAAPEEITTLVRAGQGSPGRALALAGLDLAAIDREIDAAIGDGDRDLGHRRRLGKQLSSKAAQPRYEAFLDRVPTRIADVARTRTGPALRTALDAYDEARALSSAARTLSLDAQATVFEMTGIAARLGRDG